MDKLELNTDPLDVAFTYDFERAYKEKACKQSARSQLKELGDKNRLRIIAVQFEGGQLGWKAVVTVGSSSETKVSSIYCFFF